MLLLEATQLEKSFGDRQLFKLEQLEIRRHDRVGIVGRNGVGKTTLLHLLAGEEPLLSGKIKRYAKTALIRQFGPGDAAETSARHRAVWGVTDVHDGMSGGEQVRLKIAHALEQGAQLLFADEPTSHLDMQGIEQLEKALKDYDGALVLISHDRSLLDAVCTRILEIEDGVITEYQGNYSHYQEQKEHRRKRAHDEFDAYQREWKRLNQAIVEKKQRATGMSKIPKRFSSSEARLYKEGASQRMEKVEKSTKALETRLARLKKKEKPREIARVQFDTAAYQEVHAKAAIMLDQVSRHTGDRTLFHKLSCTIKPGMKVALVGRNGAGKSTLLSMIAEGAPGIHVSQSCQIGYFAQSLSLLDESQTILANVAATSSQSETLIRTALARLLFREADVHKPVHLLSGGEKSKTALAKVFLSDANLLLLDEPTNYLDLLTQVELEQMLADYPGTIVFATHDRTLINKVADHVLVWEETGPVFYQGNYQQYVAWKETRNEARSAGADDLLLLQTKQGEIIGRLSMPIKDAALKEELEQQYQDITQKLRALRARMGK
ncbi:ribosomal protection-like ABC-F family protein [Brevibacillus fluminis]|uniref:ribosomal protection-like ABC-F family protein n=1 Tax=Brevibacillus fluminis TaxID=511487 RepID=UPI003F8AC453